MIDVKDMKKKNKNGEEFTQEELQYIYCGAYDLIDNLTEHQKMALRRITETRNQKKDIAALFDLDEDDISLTVEEALSGTKKLHFGDLEIKGIKELNNINMPRIFGSFISKSLKTITNVNFSDIDGSYLVGATKYENVNFGEYVNGDMEMLDMWKADNVTLPKEVYGDLQLMRLREINNFTYPEKIGGILYNLSLKELKDAKLPNYVGDRVIFAKCESIENTILPEKIMGSLDINTVKTIDKTTFPKSVDYFGAGNLKSVTNSIINMEATKINVPRLKIEDNNSGTLINRENDTSKGTK